MILISFLMSIALSATCNDGTHSDSTGRGTCSHHGGVASWSDISPSYHYNEPINYNELGYEPTHKMKPINFHYTQHIDAITDNGNWSHFVYYEDKTSADSSLMPDFYYNCQSIDSEKIYEEIGIRFYNDKYKYSKTYDLANEDLFKMFFIKGNEITRVTNLGITTDDGIIRFYKNNKDSSDGNYNSIYLLNSDIQTIRNSDKVLFIMIDKDNPSKTIRVEINLDGISNEMTKTWLKCKKDLE